MPFTPYKKETSSEFTPISDVMIKKYQEQEVPKRTLGEKVLDFTGGKEIAQGLGQAIAQPKITKSLAETQASQIKIQSDLLEKIKQNKAQGLDTSRLENALSMITEDIQATGQGAERLLNPAELTTKKVLGDTLQLATTAGGAKLAGAVAGKVGQAVTTGQGIAQGAKLGALGGGAVGALTGTAQALEEEKEGVDIAKGAAKGSLIGAGTGLVIGGITGGISGFLQGKKLTNKTLANHLDTAKMELEQMPADRIDELGGVNQLLKQNKQDIVLQLRSQGLNKKADQLSKLNIDDITNFDEYSNLIKETVSGKVTKTPSYLQAITPETKDLTPTEYEDLLNRGKITPKTTTQPSKYILSNREKMVAEKYKNILTNDPVKNTQNLINEIVKKDKDVGNFLKKNNGIYNTGELRNNLTQKLEGIDDLTVDEARLNKLKQSTIDNFLKSLKKNDMETLWKARKEFDKSIEKAFSGSPNLQNTIKREFRNAIQDFIAERTPDNVYKTTMQEMSELFNLKDITNQKAIKEKGMNAVQLWIKRHPTRTKIIGGIAGTGVLTGIGASLLKD